ncbi:hypothetical protein WOSG25_091160 [Weissella oryzae SG25]|uniref:DUF910 family protein n=2 Tax=Weissella TaxID=46255 RepID=A0A069CVK5_WEIOS|nr:hypothetical protein WOSG25_091160 [Weissella oryzae SG25]
MAMRTFLDVLDLLKNYDVYIHIGKRLWDIEVAALEIDNLYKAGLLDVKEYGQIKLVLAHEHELEERKNK